MAAACTRLTISGEGASDVISQLAPVFWIHMPVLEARLAIQSARKAGWWREAKAPGDDMLGAVCTDRRDGRNGPTPFLVQAMRTRFGPPSSGIRFRA